MSDALCMLAEEAAAKALWELLEGIAAVDPTPARLNSATEFAMASAPVIARCAEKRRRWLWRTRQRLPVHEDVG